MILPEGNSKKYIKVVIGIYVLFTIVSPNITKISGKEIQVSDIIDLDEAMARGTMYRDFERHAYEETCNLFRKEVQ